MRFATGFLILLAYAPCVVWADGAAAAAASSAAAAADEGGAAAATAVAAAAATAVSDSPPPPIYHPISCNCPDIYAPVCATNGRTYSNMCIFRCVRDVLYKLGYRIELKHKGKCHPRPCKCPKKYDPICGTNKKTYPNDCYRVCENIYRAKHKLPLIGLKHKGFCKHPYPCRCPNVYIPVCGTDGNTYDNICKLQCASDYQQAHCKSPIYVDYPGPCCKVKKCRCPKIEKPVCASDNKTYLNQCWLDYENELRRCRGQLPLTIKYPGKCYDCICPAVYDPVCGSDGVTYPNLCQLKCANKERRCQGKPDVTVLWPGHCNCGCKRTWKPVCVRDGNKCVTWPNRCLVRCENRKRKILGRPLLYIRYEGVCRWNKPC